MATREILVQTSSSMIANYAMQTFKLIEKINRGFYRAMMTEVMSYTL